MADQGQFLDPRDQQAMQQDTGPGLADQWRGWLKNPQNQAFLLQAGVALMQPRPEHQTALGQIGGALGAGGEASHRVAQIQEAEAEGESKRQYRQQNVEAAHMRADAALMKGEAALQRAQMATEAGGDRPMTAGQRASMYVKAQSTFKKWLLDPGTPGQPDALMDLLGIQDKKELNRDPAKKQQAIEFFLEGVPAMSPAKPQPNRTPVPGGSRMMPGPEGQASGLYNSDEINMAVSAIHAGQNRERVLQQYEMRTRKSRKDVLDQL